MINFSDPYSDNLIFKKEIKKTLASFVDNNKNYILGKNISLFENELSKFLGLKHSITVKNGTDAIVIALKSIGLRIGDEVIMPSLTATATMSAVMQLGGFPIFSEVDENFHTLNFNDIDSLVTPKTKAIIFVNLYGQGMDTIEYKKIIKKYKKKLYFIEDCAQSFGTKFQNQFISNLSHIYTYSFFPTKNLSALGDGGAISTNDSNLAKKINMLRQYGWDKYRVSIFNGYNSRMDEMQACILRIKLKKIKSLILKRRSIAKYYNSNLKNLPVALPLERKNIKHSYHLYVIKVNPKIRNKLLSYLEIKGIKCGLHYKVPCHQMPVAKKFNNKKLTITDKLSDSIISLPNYPSLKLTDQNYIIENINNFFTNKVS